ncbi:MAG: glycosyltransferase family A protein, partial [Chloroflexota bacterium]
MLAQIVEDVLIQELAVASTIKAGIESLLAQTLRPKEIIVIDDGSTDETKQIVERFESPVEYHVQKNQGAPAARNAGARIASG